MQKKKKKSPNKTNQEYQGGQGNLFVCLFEFNHITDLICSKEKKCLQEVKLNSNNEKKEFLTAQEACSKQPKEWLSSKDSTQSRSLWYSLLILPSFGSFTSVSDGHLKS